MPAPLRPIRFLVALALTLAGTPLAHAAQSAPPVDITTCGQVVTGAARLVSDLDCSTYEGLPYLPAVTLANHGSLDLNGHTIVAGNGRGAVLCGLTCKDGVNFCAGDCTVSNGAIAVPTTSAVLGRNVTVRNMTIRVNTYGVTAKRRLTIMDSTIGGSDYIEAEGRWIKIYRSTLTGPGLAGISTAPRNSSVKLFDTTVTGHQCDLSTWRLPRLHDSTCTTSCGDARDGSGTWGICTDD